MTTPQFDTSGAVRMVAPDVKSAPRDYVRFIDLSPFAQGYVEALARSCIWINHKGVEQPFKLVLDHGTHRSVQPFRFSDLAPETLARIMEDCEAYARSTELPEGLKFHGPLQQAQIAASFWECRQSGAYPQFPPLTVYLGGDGRVRFQEAGQ